MADSRSNRSASCVFPLITTVLALSYHALIAAMCSYLPQDSMAIGYGLASYATAGCAISLLGIYGILTVSALSSHNHMPTRLTRHLSKTELSFPSFHTSYSWTP